MFAPQVFRRGLTLPGKSAVDERTHTRHIERSGEAAGIVHIVASHAQTREEHEDAAIGDAVVAQAVRWAYDRMKVFYLTHGVPIFL